MNTVSIKRLQDDLPDMRKELEHLKTIVEEDYALADDVVRDLEASKTRDPREMIPHETMRTEFGE